MDGQSGRGARGEENHFVFSKDAPVPTVGAPVTRAKQVELLLPSAAAAAQLSLLLLLLLLSAFNQDEREARQQTALAPCDQVEAILVELTLDSGRPAARTGRARSLGGGGGTDK